MVTDQQVRRLMKLNQEENSLSNIFLVFPRGKPIITHPFKEIAGDWISGVGADDGIDAAFGAHCTIASINPIIYLIRREYVQAMEAAAQFACMYFISMIGGMLMGLYDVIVGHKVSLLKNSDESIEKPLLGGQTFICD